MAKVLVTGAAGFIGSNLVRELIRVGHDVIGLDDFSGGVEENLPRRSERFRFYAQDVCAPLDHIFRQESPEYVYHLAAYAAEGLSPYIRAYNYQNNVVGSMNVINACINTGVKKLIFTSSCAIYGNAQQCKETETNILSCMDPYGIAKITVEADIKLAHKSHGLNYAIFRPHNVYGPYQNLRDPFRNVVGIFMRQVINDEPMTVFGDGQQVRQFSHISTLMGPFLRAMDPDIIGAYNIGGSQSYKVIELAQKIGRASGKDFEIDFLPPRHEAQTVEVDHSRAEKAFGPLKSVPLEEGIEDMFRWAWMQRKGSRIPPPVPFTKIEVTKSFPQAWRHYL